MIRLETSNLWNTLNCIANRIHNFISIPSESKDTLNHFYKLFYSDHYKDKRQTLIATLSAKEDKFEDLKVD